MKIKAKIMDEAAVKRSMTRITHEIIEKNSGTDDLVLLGVRRRGMPLAAMLRDNFIHLGEPSIPLGSIDISLYRDDLTEVWEQKFQTFRRNRAESSSYCRECRFRDVCQGDAAHTWNYDLNEPGYCIAREIMEAS